MAEPFVKTVERDYIAFMKKTDRRAARLHLLLPSRATTSATGKSI